MSTCYGSFDRGGLNVFTDVEAVLEELHDTATYGRDCAGSFGAWGRSLAGALLDFLRGAVLLAACAAYPVCWSVWLVWSLAVLPVRLMGLLARSFIGEPAAALFENY